MNRRTRVVILGGGFGGLVVARQLSRSKQSSELDIVVIDANPKHIYAPWLYELATSCLTDSSSREEWQSAQTALDFSFHHLRGYREVRFRQAKISEIDERTKHVVLEDGFTVPYDYLVIALGAVPNYFAIPGLEKACVPLKSLNDAYQIRRSIILALRKRKVGQMLNVLVGGAGASGTEFASELAATARAAAERGMIEPNTLIVTLIDAAPSALMLCSKSVRQVAQRRLQSLGVRLKLNTAISSARDGHVILATNPTPGAEKTEPVVMPYDVCVWSGGITVSDTIRKMPFAHDAKGRIIVDATMRVVERDQIFTIGDCAASRNPFTHLPDPQTAQVAVAQAKVVANNILRNISHQSLVTFAYPRHWPIIVTLGGKNACGVIGPLTIRGYSGYLLRRLADLKYFLEVLSVRDAWRFWRRGVKMYAKNEEGE